MKQIFKGESLSRTVVKNNILKIWGLTDDNERRDWYKEANDFAVENAPFKTEGWISITCGIIAALSPVKTWEQNKKCTIDMLNTGDCGHMGQFKKKARDILLCKATDDGILSILNGNKISAFYLNIKYPNQSNVLTIDRHALSIALGRWVNDEDYRGMTTKQYEFFVHCYTIAAMKVGVSPILMQSATWVKFRKIKQNYR